MRGGGEFFLSKCGEFRECEGVADLYTSELGTSPPPELGTTRLAYIRIRQNRHRYNMEYRK